MSFCSRDCNYSFKRKFNLSLENKKQIGSEQLLRIYVIYHDNTIENIYKKVS